MSGSLGILALVAAGLSAPKRAHAKDATPLADRAFFGEDERSSPGGSMDIQLPTNSYPEFGRHIRMYEYDHFLGYLHSRHLRRSDGTPRGRETEGWQSRPAALATAELVDRLVTAGFGGSTSTARATRRAGEKSSRASCRRSPWTRLPTPTAPC